PGAAAGKEKEPPRSVSEVEVLSLASAAEAASPVQEPLCVARGLADDLYDLMVDRWGTEAQDPLTEVAVEIAKALSLAIDARAFFNDFADTDAWSPTQLPKITKILAAHVTALKTGKGVDWVPVEVCDGCGGYRERLYDFGDRRLCGYCRHDAQRE